MIPLAPKFRAKGFSWRIVQREGDVAIVEQNKEGWREPVLNVVIVQKHKGRTYPNGDVVPDREGLPSWEQWGEAAWTCSGRDDAKMRFNALVDAAANALSAPDVVAKAGSEGEKGIKTR
jgi:hypothetical protein